MERINISLHPEVAKKLRMKAVEKYGNMRSLSRLIEDLADLGLADIPTPEEIKRARIDHILDVIRDPANAKCIVTADGMPGTCGRQPERGFKCLNCEELFEVLSPPACCPICRSTDLEEVDTGIFFEARREQVRSALMN